MEDILQGIQSVKVFTNKFLEIGRYRVKTKEIAQRIVIARAMLKNPKILILDEATSSLDSEADKLAQDPLEKLMEGRTSIVIAHRFSTIGKADQLLVIDQGRLLE